MPFRGNIGAPSMSVGGVLRLPVVFAGTSVAGYHQRVGLAPASGGGCLFSSHCRGLLVVSGNIVAIAFLIGWFCHPSAVALFQLARASPLSVAVWSPAPPARCHESVGLRCKVTSTEFPRATWCDEGHK